MMENLISDIIRLVLAVVIGALIGTEREKSGKPVGMRTLAIVCIGSALATIVSVRHFPADTTGRVIAGIITGIGFLGAGAIIAEGKSVKGLTTAASIWTVSIIGVVVGLGSYTLAVVVGILVYGILRYHERKSK